MQIHCSDCDWLPIANRSPRMQGLRCRNRATELRSDTSANSATTEASTLSQSSCASIENGSIASYNMPLACMPHEANSSSTSTTASSASSTLQPALFATNTSSGGVYRTRPVDDSARTGCKNDGTAVSGDGKRRNITIIMCQC